MTDHPEYGPLLAACCVSPDDDTPRGILADWLDDHGQAGRAAFIRRQCEPGYVPDWRCPDDPPVRTLTPEQHRHRVMLPGFRLVGWNGDAVCYTPTWPMVKRLDVVFRRGFPSEITTTAEIWVAHGDALSWHPDEARECPPTACPGLTVRLTTEPAVRLVDSGWSTRTYPRWGLTDCPGVSDLAQPGDTLRKTRLRLLSLRWPGVRAWHLPESDPSTRYIRDDIRRSFEAPFAAAILGEEAP